MSDSAVWCCGCAEWSPAMSYGGGDVQLRARAVWVMRTTTGVPAAKHTAVSSMRKAYQPGHLSSVAQAAPRYRSGGPQKVSGAA